MCICQEKTVFHGSIKKKKKYLSVSIKAVPITVNGSKACHKVDIEWWLIAGVICIAHGERRAEAVIDYCY